MFWGITNTNTFFHCYFQVVFSVLSSISLHLWLWNLKNHSPAPAGFQNQAIALTGSVNPLEKTWNGSDTFEVVVALTLKTLWKTRSVSSRTHPKTVFLQGNNFQTEDSAVYYCARESQWLNKPHLSTKTWTHESGHFYPFISTQHQPCSYSFWYSLGLKKRT